MKLLLWSEKWRALTVNDPDSIAAFANKNDSFLARNYRVASNQSVKNLPLSCVVVLPVTFDLFCVCGPSPTFFRLFCVFVLFLLWRARCWSSELVCCDCWTSHKYLWALKKKKKKKICSLPSPSAASLFVPVGIFVCAFFFCLYFPECNAPCEYVPRYRKCLFI